MPAFDTPIITNDQSLDRVLANSLPVLLILNSGNLDSTLITTLNEIARSEAGKLLVARVAPAENPVAARRFNTNGGLVAIGWNNGEKLRLQSPSPTQLRQTAKFLLGRAPAPKQEPVNSDTVDQPIKVTEATFDQQVLKSKVPVLVDFWAAWCGPCRMIAPSLEKLGREYQGRVKIAKLNVDENPSLAARYGAHSIPLLVMFRDGKPFKQILGAHPEPNIRNLIEQALH